MAMMGINPNLLKPIHTKPVALPQTQKSNAVSCENFDSILRKSMDDHSEIKISKHAEARLQSRNINISADQLQRIENGVKKAQEKGIKDSLIMMDNIAFVVNVKSKTVVTALGSNETKQNVFTNIDGAVFV